MTAPPATIRNDLILMGLRRRWRLIALVWSGAWLLGYAFLRQVWSDHAGRWVWLTGAALATTLGIVWRGLPENHRDDEADLLPSFGPGNHLTLLRGLAISMVAGFLFSPWPQGWLAWAPVALYTLADIADYLDGYLARITNHVTLLGARLDMEFDSLGMLVVSLLAVWYGQLPWWYLILGSARYFFIVGVWRRERQGKPVHDIPPSVHRRIVAGFQMGFMSAALWPIIPAAGATIAGTVFAGGTTVSFWRDWQVASGRLHVAAPGYLRARRRLYIIFTGAVPVFLRLIVVAAMGSLLGALPKLFPPSSWTDLLTTWHLPWPRFWAGLAVVMAILATLAVGLGAVGRLAAFLLVFPIGFDMVVRGLLWSNGVALTAVSILMLLGTGKWSLWQPEERYMTQRAGERKHGEQP